jgi:dTMP kinase
MMNNANQNVFISFEGIDGSGKSTLAQFLFDQFTLLGYSVWLTAEPTSQRFGRLIQDWILYSDAPLSSEEQILLFTADRLAHARQIRSFLEKGYMVITDRYLDSTAAYQGVHEKACQLIHHIEETLFQDLLPKITFLLDIDPEISLQRIQRKKDQFEALHFLTGVRKRYQKIALENPERVIILDGKLTPQELEKKMRFYLKERGLFSI